MGRLSWLFPLPKLEDEKDAGAILDAEVYAHFKSGRNCPGLPIVGLV